MLDTNQGRALAVLVMVLTVLVVLAGCLSAVDGIASAPERELRAPTFENATAESGLDYAGTGKKTGNGNNGVYAADVNNDSWTDLLVVGGKRPALFTNRGGTFERRASFPDITTKVKSATFVDYDGDGWEDIVFFPIRGAPVALHNDAGEFQRIDLGLGNLTYPLGATVADYDGDGDRDMFVYQSGDWAENNPDGFLSMSYQVADDNGYENVLYENTGSGFERVEDAGISGQRWSLAASFVDLTGDGRPDIHVANDFNNDTLYINRGDGTFDQRFLGGSTARNAMASEVGDVNGDGRPDIFVTNIYLPLRESRDKMSKERYERVKHQFGFVAESGRTKGNNLLINQGGGSFADRANEYGVRKGGWGWAASYEDFTNDGIRDLVQATQFVLRLDPDDPKWTYPMVWRGQSNNISFARVNPSTHGIAEHSTRGMATLDYDNDGDLDLVMATYYGPVMLYENTVDEGHSVQFEIVDEQGATALGAVVTVEANDRTTIVRQTDENDYLSQESRIVHVGLGDAERATVTVTWPDGTIRTFEVTANQRLRLSKDGVEVVADLAASANRTEAVGMV